MTQHTVNDRRIACETLADDHNIPESTVVDYDYAPESYWLSKDAEFDWFDRNAFLDRKESIKGNSYSMNLNPIVNPSPSNTTSASSLQISAFLKSKAAQQTSYADSKRRNCKLANIMLFPKRSDSIEKEPSSPKVSCLGRVRSKSCHRRRKSKPAGKPEKPVTRHEKTGFVSCLRSLFRFNCGKSNQPLPRVNRPSENLSPRSHNVTCKSFDDEPEATVDQPGLGFSSGRRRETGDDASW